MSSKENPEINNEYAVNDLINVNNTNDVAFDNRHVVLQDTVCSILTTETTDIIKTDKEVIKKEDSSITTHTNDSREHNTEDNDVKNNDVAFGSRIISFPEGATSSITSTETNSNQSIEGTSTKESPYSIITGQNNTHQQSTDGTCNHNNNNDNVVLANSPERENSTILTTTTNIQNNKGTIITESPYSMITSQTNNSHQYDNDKINSINCEKESPYEYLHTTSRLNQRISISQLQRKRPKGGKTDSVIVIGDSLIGFKDGRPGPFSEFKAVERKDVKSEPIMNFHFQPESANTPDSPERPPRKNRNNKPFSQQTARICKY